MTARPWGWWGLAWWVYRVGNTRALPTCQVQHPQAHIPAERAPEALQGLEWVVIWASPLDRPRGRPSPYPPCGPGRSCQQALPGRGLGSQQALGEI